MSQYIKQSNNKKTIKNVTHFKQKIRTKQRGKKSLFQPTQYTFHKLYH